MKLSITILLLLSAFSHAFEDESLRYLAYQEIDNDKFGKTLVDTLELHVKSGEPIGQFLDTMRDFEGQIESEMKEDTQGNKEFQSQCDRDLDNSVQEINDINLTITEKQSKLDELNNELAKKKQIQSAKQGWLKSLNDQLEQKTTQRNQEKQKFDAEINENSYVLYVITEVKKKFLQTDGISLVQLSDQQSLQLAEQLEDDLENAVDESKNFRQNTQYQQLFSLLAQIASRSKVRGNTDALKQLKDIAEQLLFSVSDNMSLLRNQEDKSTQIFEKEKSTLEKHIQNVSGDSAQIEADVSNLENKIEMSTNDLADYKSRLSNKEQTRKDRQQECQLQAYNFKQSREDNEKKRQLVSEVIGLFSANQREFKEYLHLRSQI